MSLTCVGQGEHRHVETRREFPQRRFPHDIERQTVPYRAEHDQDRTDDDVDQPGDLLGGPSRGLSRVVSDRRNVKAVSRSAEICVTG